MQTGTSEYFWRQLSAVVRAIGGGGHGGGRDEIFGNISKHLQI